MAREMNGTYAEIAIGNAATPTAMPQRPPNCSP